MKTTPKILVLGHGRHGKDTVAEMLRDRHGLSFTGSQISVYNTPDKARLAREVLEVGDLYVGMRSNAEYAASKELFDHTLWVLDPRKPLEGRDSFNIDRTPEMQLIMNDGTLEDLQVKVDEFAAQI